LQLQEDQSHRPGRIALPGAAKKKSSPAPRDAGSRSSDNPQVADAMNATELEADGIQLPAAAPTRPATGTWFLLRR
jgi:hypothetical protein